MVEVEDEDVGILLPRTTPRRVQGLPFERANSEFRAVWLAAHQETIQNGLAGGRTWGGLIKKDIEASLLLGEPWIRVPQGLRKPCDDGG